MTIIHPEAFVSQDATVGVNARIWELATVREMAIIGDSCIVGRGAYVDVGVQIGSRCKVQNSAMIYSPAIVGDGVFIGPGVIFTNDRFPRAVNPDGTQKSASDWDSVGVKVGEGASIGAGAICVAPVTLGPWSVVAAGSVVTKDVRAHSLVKGIPARHVCWVGRAGRPLRADGELLICDVTGERYRDISGTLVLEKTS